MGSRTDEVVEQITLCPAGISLANGIGPRSSHSTSRTSPLRSSLPKVVRIDSSPSSDVPRTASPCEPLVTHYGGHGGAPVGLSLSSSQELERRETFLGVGRDNGQPAPEVRSGGGRSYVCS